MKMCVKVVIINFRADFLHFRYKMALDKNAKDVSKQGNIRNEHLYEMISNTAGFTVKYLF